MTFVNLDKLKTLKTIGIKAFIWFILVAGLSFLTCLTLDKICQSRSLGYHGLLDKTNKRPEIVVLGASRAQCHYVTPLIAERTGLSAYNFGYGGTSVLSQYSQLMEILKVYKPRLVIYEVVGGDFHETYLSRSLEYLKLFPDNEYLREARREGDDYSFLRTLFPMYKYNKAGLNIGLSLFRPTRTEGIMGYHSLKDAQLPILLRHAEEESPQGEYVRNSLLSDCFEEILRLADSENLNMLFIRSPLFDNTKGGYPPDDPKVFDKLKESGFDFHDYGDVNLYGFQDPNLWADYYHLGNTGAVKYTNMIMPLIQKTLAEATGCWQE